MKATTQIAARLETELLEQVDRAASEERRSRSGQIEYILRRAITIRRTHEALRRHSQQLREQGDYQGYAALERVSLAINELRNQLLDALPRVSGEGKEFLQAFADGLTREGAV